MEKKILFKGIQQVTWTYFNEEVTAENKKGYLWFVRKPVEDAEGAENPLGNDQYFIYFGTRCYGSFWEGQIEAMADALEAMRMSIGLDENYEFEFGEATTVKGALAALETSLNDKVAAINQALEDKANKSDVETALAAFLVKDVDANDKVLSVADGILSSALNLKYENNRISLIGKNNEEIAGFDASAFVKDSVLDDVKVETKEDGEKYIIFTWKTEGDEAKTDEIKVSDFAKLYNAGTAMELAQDGVTFNVKVAANGNFLSVNDSNELIVDDVTTDKTMLKEAITIEGGPLASDAVKAAFKDGVIPAGTDIQAVLKALLCVEIYPEATVNNPSYTASISKPTITAKVNDKSISSTALVEVGQVVEFAAVTATKVNTTPTDPKVTGFKHGYSDSLTGDIVDATSITGSWDIKQADETVYTLVCSKSNFDGNVPESDSDATHSNCQVAACSLTAVQGENSYSVTETAPQYVGTSTAIGSKYIVSNLGGRSEEHKSDAIAAKENIPVTASEQTQTFKVTGTYPMYTNGVVGSLTSENKPSGDNLMSPVDGDGTKLALMGTGSIVISFASQGLAPYRLYIPQPLNWKISKALYTNPLTGKVEQDGTTFFVKNGTTTRTIQNKSVTYDVYEWAATQGADFVKFTVASK